MFEVAITDSRAFGKYRENLLAGLPACRKADGFVLSDVCEFRYHVTPPGLDENTETAKST